MFKLIIICYLLPSTIFFTPISSRHKYKTRLASKSACYIPSARTNYGKFKIRFKGAFLWNNIDNGVQMPYPIVGFVCETLLKNNCRLLLSSLHL